MAAPLTFKIKQSVSELKNLMMHQPEHLRNRVLMLLVCRLSKQDLSKNSLAEIIGVNSNSIQNWRKMYVEGGINKLLEFNRGGYKPSVINATVHRAIEKKLKSATKSLHSYAELRLWIDERFIPGINYHTVNKYIKRKFSSAIWINKHAHRKLAGAKKAKTVLRQSSDRKKSINQTSRFRSGKSLKKNKRSL